MQFFGPGAAALVGDTILMCSRDEDLILAKRSLATVRRLFYCTDDCGSLRRLVRLPSTSCSLCRLAYASRLSHELSVHSSVSSSRPMTTLRARAMVLHQCR